MSVEALKHLATITTLDNTLQKCKICHNNKKFKLLNKLLACVISIATGSEHSPHLSERPDWCIMSVCGCKGINFILYCV
jgi:hypothetical protein